MLIGSFRNRSFEKGKFGVAAVLRSGSAGSVPPTRARELRCRSSRSVYNCSAAHCRHTCILDIKHSTIHNLAPGRKGKCGERETERRQATTETRDTLSSMVSTRTGDGESIIMTKLSEIYERNGTLSEEEIASAAALVDELSKKSKKTTEEQEYILDYLTTTSRLLRERGCKATSTQPRTRTNPQRH